MENNCSREILQGWNIRFNLIRGISSDHVLNGEITTGMSLHERVQLEDKVFTNDNCVAIGDKALDLERRDDAIAVHV